MGIKIEFNPDLALRNIEKFRKGQRLEEECIPAIMEMGNVYVFFKKGQRNYWLHGEIPLVETKGNEKLFRPKASVQILEAKHFLVKSKKNKVYPLAKKNKKIKQGEIWTKGKYKVLEVFKDDKVYFEGLDRINKRN